MSMFDEIVYGPKAVPSRRRQRMIRKAIEAMNLGDRLVAEAAAGLRPPIGGEFTPNVVNDFLMARNRRVGAITDRQPSGAVWSSCPWNEIQASGGMHVWDDFNMMGTAPASGAALAGSAGRWSTYMYQGGTLADAQLEGGVITLGSDGDQEGVALLSQAGTFRMVTTSTLALNKKLWFEARVSRSTITQTKGEFFCGLMAPTLSSGLPAAAQPITTTDDTLMTAGDLFGFHCDSTTAVRGGPTEVAVAFCLASGTVNYPTGLTTLMASSTNTVLAANVFVKLGFVFDPNALPRYITSATARQTAGTLRKPLIQFYVNNLGVATFLSSDDVANATATQAFPTAFMAPVFAHMNTTGSTPGTSSIDWIRVAQQPLT